MHYLNESAKRLRTRAVRVALFSEPRGECMRLDTLFHVVTTRAGGTQGVHIGSMGQYVCKAMVFKR